VPWSASDPALHISGVNDGFTTLGTFATAFPNGVSIVDGANGGTTTVAETGPGLLVLEPASPTDALAGAVPEPATATLAFVAVGAVAFAAARRRA